MASQPGQPGLKAIQSRANHRPVFILPTLGTRLFTTVFNDNRQYSYFLYFQEEATVQMSNHFDQDLFSHVIVQASWNEPCLCQLAAALGALSKAGNSSTSNVPKRTPDPHWEYALEQYGQALKSVQSRISGDGHRDSTRIALIAALLVYVFENLYGDLDLAVKHLENALELMRTQLARASRRYRHSKNSSPTSNLDDDLVAAFFRLDGGLTSRNDIYKFENINSGLGIKYLENVYEIPKKFNSISEARNHLENIQFPVAPYLSHDVSRIYTSPSPPEISDNARHMYTNMSSHFRQWELAFAPLYTESRTPGSKISIAAATLRVRSLSTELVSQRLCAKAPASHQLLNTISREMVDLSKFVVADPSFRKSFVLDCGIVPGMSIVIAACMDMSMRKEALEILKDVVPRREGVWDSMSAVKNGEICLQMSGNS